MFNTKRIKYLNNKEPQGKGPVIYWMCRDQRANDNWSLIYAQQIALKEKRELIVIFCLRKNFSHNNERIVNFMLNGLSNVERQLADLNIPFFIVTGNPEYEIERIINNYNASLLIADFFPLKWNLAWKKKLKDKINIQFIEIDSHNIIPCFYVSNKQEFAAYTIRPKITKYLDEFLTEYPKIIIHPFNKKQSKKLNFSKIKDEIKINKHVIESSEFKSGENNAKKFLSGFIKNKIIKYNENKNNPNLNFLSNLSPYLHFGQISSQRIVLDINASIKNLEIKKSFLEEIIVRKELSDNFCYYNNNYDSLDGIPDWAKKSLSEHINDKRDYLYTLAEFENGHTHDQLWNSAQKEMVITGKMHGYLRMYWAKKILEWTKDPSEAIKIAIYLNDEYSLDGRDPNGYAGILWSIGGLHDRPWFERKIFGKIRYMNYNGASRKFDIQKYIEKINALETA